MILCARCTSRSREQRTKCRLLSENMRTVCLFYGQNDNILWLSNMANICFEKFTRCAKVCGLSFLDCALRVLIGWAGKLWSRDLFVVSGKYIYLEASGLRQGDRARLCTPWMSPWASMCLQFWYHMHGNDTGRLRIFLETRNQDPMRIWSATGDHDNHWFYGQVSIDPEQTKDLRVRSLGCILLGLFWNRNSWNDQIILPFRAWVDYRHVRTS